MAALEWRREEWRIHSGDHPPETTVSWEAEVGGYCLSVDGSEGEARWSVADLYGNDLPSGVAFTVVEAQAAAEEAAFRLLLEAVAAFRLDVPANTVLADCEDPSAWMDYEEYAGTTPDDAIALGAALIAAALRARKGDNNG